MNKILEMFKEAGIYSINRVLPGITWLIITIIVVGITVMLVIKGETWSHYGELVTLYLTVLGIIATWLTGNKFTNSKYNTALGELGKPLLDKLKKTGDEK